MDSGPAKEVRAHRLFTTLIMIATLLKLPLSGFRCFNRLSAKNSRIVGLGRFFFFFGGGGGGGGGVGLFPHLFFHTVFNFCLKTEIMESSQFNVGRVCLFDLILCNQSTIFQL